MEAPPSSGARPFGAFSPCPTFIKFTPHGKVATPDDSNEHYTKPPLPDPKGPFVSKNRVSVSTINHSYDPPSSPQPTTDPHSSISENGVRSSPAATCYELPGSCEIQSDRFDNNSMEKLRRTSTTDPPDHVTAASVDSKQTATPLGPSREGSIPLCNETKNDIRLAGPRMLLNPRLATARFQEAGPDESPTPFRPLLSGGHSGAAAMDFADIDIGDETLELLGREDYLPAAKELFNIEANTKNPTNFNPASRATVQQSQPLKPVREVQRPPALKRPSVSPGQAPTSRPGFVERKASKSPDERVVRFSESPPEIIGHSLPVTPPRKVENVPIMELPTPAVIQYFNINLAQWSPSLTRMFGRPGRTPMPVRNNSDFGRVEEVTDDRTVPDTPRPQPPPLGGFRGMPGSMISAAHGDFFTPLKSPLSRPSQVEPTVEINVTQNGPFTFPTAKQEVKQIQHDRLEQLNVGMVVRWLIVGICYMRFLQDPSILYACELILLLIGLNSVWFTVKTHVLRVCAVIHRFAAEGFHNFVSGTILNFCLIFKLVFLLSLTIILSPAFWAVTIAVLLCLALLYSEQVLYLFYSLFCTGLVFCLVKAIRAYEIEHNRLMETTGSEVVW
ncbi:hypothetical protein FN846DRAFT_903924 [Sphaerosporella brunnea]|uniref:Uncharacterized protein n=1 Tax=Sphaerosporella brunnea TaxID=1250544 RepID=A0A5J5F6C3_9PEZI|nr:hypothetical protein FN846DRAFT_903924 [Sphaerosporella brunnea]